MKKLLALTLVLSVASLATAGLTIVPDKTVASAGDIINVLVIQDIANGAGSGGEMTISFAGAVTSVTNTTAGFTSGGFWNWSFDGGIAIVPGGVWFGKVAAAGVGTPGEGSKDLLQNPYVSTVAFSFEFTGEETDLVWGGTWDGVDMTGVVGATIVPEPATMALLGLGALVLRRRK